MICSLFFYGDPVAQNDYEKFKKAKSNGRQKKKEEIWYHNLSPMIHNLFDKNI